MLRSVHAALFRPAAFSFVLMMAWMVPSALTAQGVTTSSMTGFITATDGAPLADATITAVHQPTGASYRATARAPRGSYTIPNMRVGGPYRVSVAMIGFQPKSQDTVFLSLGQNMQLDFALERQVVRVAGVDVTGEEDRILNGGRTGAATFITSEEVGNLPTIKRSTRDLTRLDPRSDGNFSFGGRNWLYNNISLDGSYFNNSFGLDDPAPGGQANAEPVPYDAIEQVQVAIAPFDVRQGGFTGANVNSVTRSGTNTMRGTIYSFYRTDALQGNTVNGSTVAANPSLSYVQSGFGIGGPLMRNKFFFYLNAEVERTEDPGSDFVASRGAQCGTTNQPLGVSRVCSTTMDSIRTLMQSSYGYDTGPYEGYIFHTDNNKLLLRLDYQLNANDNIMLRYNYLDAKREQGPHPFVLSFNNTGRGPNSGSLPFRNSGYTINNDLHSIAFEMNMRRTGWANRLFLSYNRFRDRRDPFSAPFPTLEVGEAGTQYTTVGHEPFSIHNILSQDVLQLTNNVSLYRGSHTFDVGLNFESFSFFNSFNIFRNGFFIGQMTGSTQGFIDQITPGNPAFIDYNASIGTGPYKGENIHVGQFSVYAQDNILMSPRFNLTAGVRADFPMYFTDPVDNPYSRSLTARDETGATEIVDQSVLPGTSPMFSPRVGFNWNASGDRRTQVRGGTGVFTGRVPFVWIGNVLSNPGFNGNIYPGAGAAQVPQGSPGDSSILQQSFDLNAVVEDFRWPQVWTTDIAIDRQLPWNLLGTLEVIYGKDLNAVFMRNADLTPSGATVGGPDGRPYYGSCAAVFAGACPSTTGSELNPDGAGIYVLDNVNEGSSLNVSIQMRRNFGQNASLMLAYNYLDAQNSLKSTEIASVLWQNQPISGDPNNPGLSASEFGQKHRIIGAFTYSFRLLGNNRTQVGLVAEFGQGNRFTAAGGNRYSFIYSGDVNGDGQAGNDLIYVPATQADIALAPCPTGCGANTTPAQQWAALDAFINQDSYLSGNRGRIAERMGALNPWYNTFDLRILQDLQLASGANRHGLQLSLDFLNVGNLISSSWGVRQVANPSATSPLRLVGWAAGVPQFNFTGPTSTYMDDPGLLSRWRMQVGLRYLFN